MVRHAGILRIALVIGAVAGPLAACSTYDESLLKYEDSGAPAQDASIETGPEGAPDGAADTTSEPDVEADAAEEADAQPEADAQAEADAPVEAETDAPEEPVPCSATILDCDGDAQNGCETDITKSAQHCGKCNHDCLGGACENQACQPFAIATNQSSPSGLAIDPGSTGRVYWTNRLASGSVVSVAKSGGAVTVHADAQVLPSGIVVDANNVYWANAGTLPGEGQILKIAKTADAGAAEVLASGQNTPTGMAISGTRLYWTNSYNAAGSVNQVDVTGGPAKVLVPNQDTPTGIAADETGVYWAVLDDDEIRRCYDQCITVKLVASGLNNPAVVAVDTMHAFWSEVGGNIRSWNKVTNEVIVLADSQALPMGIAIDGAHLYWANNVGNSIARVPKAGGQTEVIAGGQNGPFSIAVDNDAVYWVNGGNGTVMKWAK